MINNLKTKKNKIKLYRERERENSDFTKIRREIALERDLLQTCLN